MAQGDGTPHRDTSWHPSGRQIGMAVAILLVLLFGALNFEHAKIDFLIASVSVPLVFVITICAILGFTAGYLFARHLDRRD